MKDITLFSSRVWQTDHFLAPTRESPMGWSLLYHHGYHLQKAEFQIILFPEARPPSPSSQKSIKNLRSTHILHDNRPSQKHRNGIRDPLRTKSQNQPLILPQACSPSILLFNTNPCQFGVTSTVLPSRIMARSVHQY